MPHLLHLDASARRRSNSRALSRAYADAWRAAHPGAGYTYRDLALEPPPVIGEAWTEICDYLLAHKITDIKDYPLAVRTSEQRAAWAIVAPLLDELVTAEVVLVGAPMYNFSIPAALKAWIDQVTFPRMSLAGRRIVVASARGGSYLPGAPRAPFDYQERYLRDFFAGHFTIEDVTFIHSEFSNATVDPHLFERRDDQKASHAAACESARQLASLDPVRGQP